MTDISNAFIAGRMLQPLRWLAALLLVFLGLGATGSHAQVTCTTGTVASSVTPVPNIKFSSGPVSGASTLATMSKTITLSGCSTFFSIPQRIDIAIEMPKVFASGTVSLISSSPSVLVQSSIALSCNVANACKDSSGAAIGVQATNNADGIMYKPQLTFTGVDPQNNNCISNVGSVGFSTVNFNNAVGLGFTNNNCASLQFTFTSTFEQNAVFKPTQTTLINSLSSIQTVEPYQLRFVPSEMIPNSLGANGFVRLDGGTPPSFVASTGTCSLTFPNSAINFRLISVDKLTAATNGTEMASQNFSMTINNCSGTAAGTKKALKWTFTTPKAGDLTRMENAASLNGATGISAQIEADSKISPVDGSALPSIITSGETYIASGKNSDNQTLTYKAKLIRNADTVKSGAFSSTATVEMFYQ